MQCIVLQPQLGLATQMSLLMPWSAGCRPMKSTVPLCQGVGTAPLAVTSVTSSWIGVHASLKLPNH